MISQTNANELAVQYPVGTVITLEGRLPDPVRLETVPTFQGKYLTLSFTYVSSDKFQKITIPFDLFKENVKILSKPGNQTFAARAAHFWLALEAERLKLAYAYDPHLAVSISSVDPLPHQIDAVYHNMLKMPRVKFLLADDPGAGKTIMAGLLLKELKIRKVVRRVLIVTPAALTTQWESELSSKFNEKFHIVSRGMITENQGRNMWQDFNQVITSIDFAKQETILKSLEVSDWDLVIVDEAHKMSAFRKGLTAKKSERYRLGEVLSGRTNHLLLMTATPHRGDPDNFSYLLQLIDKDLFSLERKPVQIGFSPRLGSNSVEASLAERARMVMLRRLKEDLKGFDGKLLFPPREVETITYRLSQVEKELYDAVTEYVRKGLITANLRKNYNASLALIVLQRRVTSSLRAIHRSLERRLVGLQEVQKRLEVIDIANLALELAAKANFPAPDTADEDEPEEIIWNREERLAGSSTAQTKAELETEIIELNGLLQLAQKVKQQGGETKLQAITAVLRQDERKVIGGDEKLLIFTEHKDTLDYLVETLTAQGLSVTFIHGRMKMNDRLVAQQDFREKCQVMVATEAAGEGINLQFCRLMINYDIPWNPNRLEQRMGRIHRYLQQRPVFIYNLVAINTREGEVLDRLLDKIQIMRRDLGNDKVFDVISTLLEGINLDLEDIILRALRSESEKLKILEQIDTAFKVKARQKFKEASGELLATPFVNLEGVAEEMKSSRNTRLVPEAAERFFILACQALDLKLEQRQDKLWRLPNVPATWRNFARENKLIAPEDHYAKFTFFKNEQKDDTSILMAPTNPMFELLVARVSAAYNQSLAKGGIFYEPGAEHASVIWLYQSSIVDGHNFVASKKLFAVRTPLVQLEKSGDITEPYNPSNLVNLVLPEDPPFLDPQITAGLLGLEGIISAEVYEKQIEPFFNKLHEERFKKTTVMRNYLNQSFEKLILQELRQHSDQITQRSKGKGKEMDLAIRNTETRISELTEQKAFRLKDLDRDESLNAGPAELLGVMICMPAPLGDKWQEILNPNPVNFKTALSIILVHEESAGREAQIVSQEDLGYSVEALDRLNKSSIGAGDNRFILVKTGEEEQEIAISPAEWDVARRLGSESWLYIVTGLTSTPQVLLVQDPAHVLPAREEKQLARYLITLEGCRKVAAV